MIETQRNLVQKILKASEEIHKQSLKGGGNVMYLSSRVSHIFQNPRFRKIIKIRKILEKINENFK
jgi:hypothetical protein